MAAKRKATKRNRKSTSDAKPKHDAKEKPPKLNMVSISALSIDSVGGDGDDPATVMGAPAWTLSGSISVAGSGITIQRVVYQIDDGPLKDVGTPPGPGGGGFSSNLDEDDFPTTDWYLLTVYAWDSANNAKSVHRRVLRV